MKPFANRALSTGAVLLPVLLAGCGASPEPFNAALACKPAPIPPDAVFEATEVPCSERSDPRIGEMSDDGIGLTSELGLAPGRYALPAAGEPTRLVVFFHGHQNDSCSWRNHLRKVAQRGAIGVAMNYTGQADKVVEPFGFIENWGWFVRSGAADSIAAARYFMDRFPSITQVFNFGASMGGNVSGYAAYAPEAVRADCSKLWDWWVVAEGVHNLTEEYTGARTVAGSGNALAQQAQQEIEEENGGTLEDVPERYSEITNVLHSAELGYLKGVVLTHGTNDQTVPVDQSRQMTDDLRSAGVPAHLFLVTGSDHVWEGSDTAKVMAVGLDELFRLMDGGAVTDGDETVAGP
jgi:hypothetical protein